MFGEVILVQKSNKQFKWAEHWLCSRHCAEYFMCIFYLIFTTALSLCQEHRWAKGLGCWVPWIINWVWGMSKFLLVLAFEPGWKEETPHSLLVPAGSPRDNDFCGAHREAKDIRNQEGKYSLLTAPCLILVLAQCFVLTGPPRSPSFSRNTHCPLPKVLDPDVMNKDQSSCCLLAFCSLRISSHPRSLPTPWFYHLLFFLTVHCNSRQQIGDSLQVSLIRGVMERVPDISDVK